MRGLDTRVAMAHARILALVDPEAGSDAQFSVAIDAQADGYHDYRAGIFDAPLMFAGEPLLIAAWEDGQGFAQSCEETENCEECSHSNGDPCSTHG